MKYLTYVAKILLPAPQEAKEEKKATAPSIRILNNGVVLTASDRGLGGSWMEWDNK